MKKKVSAYTILNNIYVLCGKANKQHEKENKKRKIQMSTNKNLEITKRAEAIEERITVALMNYNKDICTNSAINLLKLTLAVESDGLLYNRQKAGVALSPYQIERSTYNFVFGFLTQRKGNENLGEKNFYRLLFDFDHATIIARGKYLSIFEPLPAHDDIITLAQYWKKYYNTKLGKGNVNDATFKYNKYFLTK